MNIFMESVSHVTSVMTVSWNGLFDCCGRNRQLRRLRKNWETKRDIFIFECVSPHFSQSTDARSAGDDVTHSSHRLVTISKLFHSFRAFWRNFFRSASRPDQMAFIAEELLQSGRCDKLWNRFDQSWIRVTLSAAERAPSGWLRIDECWKRF